MGLSATICPAYFHPFGAEAAISHEMTEKKGGVTREKMREVCEAKNLDHLHQINRSLSPSIHLFIIQ